MWKYSYNLKGIYETPALLPESEFGGKLDRSQVEQLIQTVHTEGRTLLTELEAKQILSAYGIPVVESRTAYTAEAAVACAEAIGFPVVVKLISKTITHKSDVGGVRLTLQSPASVKTAFEEIESAIHQKVGADAFEGVTVQPMLKREDSYELIIGSSVDPQFGPVILFGAGGQLVEVFNDSAVGPPPAQHHPGPAVDGANQDLSSSTGGKGTTARRPGSAGNACWCASANWSSSNP